MTELDPDQVEKIEWEWQLCSSGKYLAIASITLGSHEYSARDVWTVTAYGTSPEDAIANCEAEVVAKLMRINDEDFWNDSNERAFRNLFRNAKNLL